MGHKKKRKKLFKAPDAEPVWAGASPDGRETMNQGAFHPEATADLRNGAATIPDVTPEMMDHAAHRAAELADGVAHHTLPYDAPIPDAAETVEETGLTPAADTHETVAQSFEATEAMVDAGGAEEVELTEADDASTDEAGAQPSAATDAFGQYNAKIFEMVRGSMASTTALVAALIQAKSMPEALALNADHLRRQVETLSAQGRELATLAQRLTLDALQPLTRHDR